MSLAAGSKLGPYEVLAMIGKGGMGEVYRAHDPRTGRDVAIKVSAERFSERFDREVRAVAALNHSNICTLYDVGPNYLVMELVEGESLDALIKPGPLPLATAMNYARQIAAALEEAHEKGVVHRDLKPGNIKIKPDGAVKVLDFGLAKQNRDSDGAVSENSPTISMAMTQAGVILGTAAYMAPEQARGKKVDRRADIWAFGVVLHEMLTGKRLFEGDDLTETLAAVVMKEPDLSAIPAEARRLVECCLQKDPKKRLQAIGDMRLVLEKEPESAAPSQSRFSKVLAMAAAALTLALAALAFIHFREQPAERQVLQYTLAAPEKAKNVTYFAVSPDGHYLVMLASGDGGAQLWVRSLDSLQTQPLAGTEDATFPFWSPDSRYIAFFAQNKLKKISVNGGPAQPLCDAPNPRGGAWSRDGVIVFSPSNGNGGLSRVPAAGGVPVPVTKVDGGGTHRLPMFLPDGQRFLYLANGGKEAGIRLASLDAKLASKEDRRLVLDVSNSEYLAPSPGAPFGHLLFVRDTTLMAQPVDPQTMEPKGDLFPVTAEPVSRGPVTASNLYSVSENGILIYQTGGGGPGTQHLWFDRTGKELGPVGGVVRSRNSFALSPEGKRVVIERIAEGSGNSDLWITDMEHSGTETRLTFDASGNGYPVWSPDGSKIAFGSNRGRNVNIYQRASNGTGQDELLFESKDILKEPWDWSRDGRFILFRVQDAKTSDDIWALPVTGEKKPFPLRNGEFRETQAQLSPDGRWLAYTSNESGSFQVYVAPFAPGFEKPITGKWQISLAGGTQPRWRGDGKELFYMAPDRKLMAVDVKATAQSFDRGAPQPLFESRSSALPGNPLVWGYVPSADGKKFLIAVAPGERAAAAPPPLTVVVNWLAGVKK